MANRPSRLLLLDTASLYFRAFFGVPDSVRAPDGTPVNAVRGLLDFIARLVGQYEPTHLACCWDNDWRPAWRVELLPTYKAHRVEYTVGQGVDVEQTPDPLEAQVPVILDVLEALGLAVVGADGYEADDVIGTLAERAAKAGMPADIVTGDRDLFQLVDDTHSVRVLYTARGVGRHEVVDEASVVRRYAVLPEQYADFATMRGDTSDGLPGVSGVGEKTAASLLRTYGDLDSIVAAAADEAGTMSAGVRGKLLAAADYLAVAPRVVAVARDLDLGDPDLRLPDPAPREPERFAELRDRWGLGGSADRALDALR
ncbi:MAG TPA: 5'-3' exonuclease [Nocardioidaceae bacterium]|nr:5'-3' exonuclease [Nocardioidaceae bacterium]